MGEEEGAPRAERNGYQSGSAARPHRLAHYPSSYAEAIVEDAARGLRDQHDAAAPEHAPVQPISPGDMDIPAGLRKGVVEVEIVRPAAVDGALARKRRAGRAPRRRHVRASATCLGQPAPLRGASGRGTGPATPWEHAQEARGRQRKYFCGFFPVTGLRIQGPLQMCARKTQPG